MQAGAQTQARREDIAREDDAGAARAEDFAYIVSHDLATEFRHVTEFAKILREELGEDIDAEALASIQFMSAAAARCHAMLMEVRAYSRAQRAHLRLRECNAECLVDTAVLQLSAEIEANGAAIAIAVSGEIVVDETLFNEALRRLIANALQFSRAGERLRVDISGGHSESGAWCLRVSDNGQGLARSYWERAFGMFWRLEPDQRLHGVGSGLTIAREIVRRHGGEATFVECDQGACVEIVVPDGGCGPAASPEKRIGGAS